MGHKKPLMNGDNNKGKNLLPLIVLVLSVLVFFRGSLLSQESLYGDDFVEYFFPLKKFIHDHLLETGSLPFWNVYQFSGTPLIANIQASMFYPLGFLYYLAGPEWAYTFSTIMHCLLGGIFMYIFMRSVCVSPLAGLVSAVIFTFNGFFMGHLYAGHLTFVQNYVWIPLVFYFLAKFARTGNLSYAAGGGLVLGIQILGGFPQIAFYTIIASCLYLLALFCLSLRNGEYNSARLTAVGAVLFVLLGFSLSAVQVLPTLEFTTLSTRGGGVSYEMATFDSLSPKEFLTFLVPDLFGNAVDGTYWRSRNTFHFWEACGYVGILPLFLVFIRPRNETHRQWWIFFMAMIALSLFLALGKHNPAYRAIYHLPGFNSFRIPAQILFLYVFSIAALAGLGLDQVRQGGWEFRKSFVLFLTMGLGFLCVLKIGIQFFTYPFFLKLFLFFGEAPVSHANMANLYQRLISSVDKSLILFLTSFMFLLAVKRMKQSSSFMIFLGSTIVFVDLFLFGSQFITKWQPKASGAMTELISHFPADPSQGRVIAAGTLFSPNDGLRYRFPSILGYDPLILKRYVHFILSSQGSRLDNHLVNLGYIRDPSAKLLKLLHVREVFVNGEKGKVGNAMPYAAVVGGTKVVAADDILPFMKGDEFNPSHAVVLESRDMIKMEFQEPRQPVISSYIVKEYKHERIALRVSTNQPGYLVLSEIFYPGWEARVDGKKTEIMRGNYLFRVIPVEKGDHEVQLDFISWPFRIGALISLITIAVSAGGVIGALRKARSRRRQKEVVQGFRRNESRFLEN